MCGIYGFIGHNAVSNTLEGIKRLEYRGYDSAGLGFVSFDFSEKIKNTNDNVKFFSGGLNLIKEVGEIKNLEKLVLKYKPQSNLCIGHTRWATHGSPNLKNCHPHYSEVGDFIVVHNGIIENYLQLKKKLKNIKFNSDTDTEVIAQLLSYYYKGNMLSTLQKVCKMIVGSYAILVVSKYDLDKIYVAKLNSPCVVGYSKDSGVVCSDINGMVDVEKKFVLPNNTYSVVTRGDVQIFDQDLRQIYLKEITAVKKNTSIGLGNFKHYMLKEINEIPKSIEDTISAYNTFEKLEEILPTMILSKVRRILIIGCGTAYHAGLMGKAIIESRCNIPVEVCIASEFLHNSFTYSKSTLCIFISQSGETADTIKAIRLVKSHGLTTLAITNTPSSTMCFEVDYTLYTFAGAEIGVASTKVYNCQVALLYMLSAYLQSIKTHNASLVATEYKNLSHIAKVIGDNNIENLCKNIAKKISDCKNIYMIGRGVDHYLSMESSLKLKEISYIHCEAIPAGELKHGSISLIDKNTTVFAFVTQENVKDKTLSNINEVLSRGGHVVVLSQFKLKYDKKVYDIKIPNVSDTYIPLVAVVYMQLVAYYTSIRLGHNPDKPRSLAKSVTVE